MDGFTAGRGRTHPWLRSASLCSLRVAELGLEHAERGLDISADGGLEPFRLLGQEVKPQ